MTQQDVKRLNELKGVLGNALREVEGLVAKYDEPTSPPKRRSLKAERKNDYKYKLLSGKMSRRSKV